MPLISLGFYSFCVVRTSRGSGGGGGRGWRCAVERGMKLNFLVKGGEGQGAVLFTRFRVNILK